MTEAETGAAPAPGSLDALFDGYRRFREDAWPDLKARYESLTDGQAPKVMVIGCSDSRVDPQQVLGAGPGDLFVLRNVAALAPPYEADAGRHGVSAAVEFAVRALGVERIVVLGHSGCGGVKALFDGAPAAVSEFIPGWVDIAERARGSVDGSLEGQEASRAREQACVGVTIENLETYPWVAERVADGRLALTGLHFTVGDGCLRCRADAGVWADVPRD